MADSADVTLSESYRLPIDCLLDRSPQDPVNLPLVAFSYLMRRLTVGNMLYVVFKYVGTHPSSTSYALVTASFVISNSRTIWGRSSRTCAAPHCAPTNTTT